MYLCARRVARKEMRHATWSAWPFASGSWQGMATEKLRVDDASAHVSCREPLPARAVVVDVDLFFGSRQHPTPPESLQVAVKHKNGRSFEPGAGCDGLGATRSIRRHQWAAAVALHAHARQAHIRGCRGGREHEGRSRRRVCATTARAPHGLHSALT